MKPLIIFFAGSAAGGKTEMAHFLSEQFGLPILATDSIRHDVKVSTNTVDINDVIEEFNTERERRFADMLGRKRSFIYDASVDRKWPELRQKAEESGYGWFLIDFDLSRDRIMKNRQMFDRPQFEEAELVDGWLADHDKFHAEFDDDAQLHINDENYQRRYDLATQAIKGVLSQDGN